MLIKRVQLENVKSHSDFEAEFEPGVNAIVGPNGSGKSTILEAIGYCLFNSLPYKVSHFVKNGEKQGRIVVTIEHDDEWYHYTRQVGGREPTYSVHDDRGNFKHEGVEAVQTFTKQLLGLTEDVELASIFEDAIGVQQGLLTAPFILTKTKRHAIFQPLFDIDIYRKCFEKLRPVETMLADLVAAHGHEIEKNGLTMAANQKAVDEYQERDRRISDYHDQLKPVAKNHETMMAEEKIVKSQLKALRDAERHTNMIDGWVKDIGHIKEKLEEVSEKKTKLVKLTPHVRNRKNWSDSDKKMKELFIRQVTTEEQLNEARLSIPELEEAVEDYDLSGMEDSKKVADKLDEREKALAEAGKERATAAEKHRSAEEVRERTVEGVCPILKIDCTELECFCETAREIVSKANDNRKAAIRTERDAKAAVKESKQALESFNRLENDAAMKQAYERELGTARENERGLVEKYDSQGRKHKAAQKKRDGIVYDEQKYAQAIALQKQLEDEWDENSLMARKAELDGNIANFTKSRDELETIGGGATEVDLEKIESHIRSLVEEMGQLQGKIDGLETQQAPVDLYQTWLGSIKTLNEKITSMGMTQHNEELALELVKEMRRVFNSLGPEIMELLLDAINMEANDYYAALTGSPDLLFWDRDFEASIRNVDGKRIFKQLSGGQQMVTAIAIRLAVLKHLGNLPIVFLDEPTANLDDERREVLASVVGNIMGYEQVLVISHGDEFSSEIENVVDLGDV